MIPTLMDHALIFLPNYYVIDSGLRHETTDIFDKLSVGDERCVFAAGG
jgi:hypothetical protein